MNIGIFGEWLDVIYKLGVVAFGIWMYLARRNDKTNVRITKLEERLDERLDTHTERLTRVETELTKQPTHDHLAEVYREIRKTSDALATMAITLAAMQATLENVGDLTRRMDTFWRNHNN